MRQNYRFPDRTRPDYDNVARGQELLVRLLTEEQVVEIIETRVFWVEEYPKLNKKIVHGTRALQDGEYELVIELYKNSPERDSATEHRVIPARQI